MYVAVRSNIRTASAARRGLGDALTVSLARRRGLRLPGHRAQPARRHRRLSSSSAALDWRRRVATPATIVGFGFGASFVALFAQLGGGIYTKAADVGADLVGKVEAGIPEDDPRNPAVIADLVGDNVGDCAGRGADLFESTAAENIGAMILGVAVADAIAANAAKPIPPGSSSRWSSSASASSPRWSACWSCASAVVSRRGGRPRSRRDRDGQLNRGYYVTAVLAAIGIFVVAVLAARHATEHWWVFGLCGLVGIADQHRLRATSPSTTPLAPTGRCGRSPRQSRPARRRTSSPVWRSASRTPRCLCSSSASRSACRTSSAR